MRKYIEYLFGRDEVNLSEMQANVGVPYLDFVSDVIELRQWGYIGLETKDDCATVNRVVIEAKERELSEEEIEKFASDLSEEAILCYEDLIAEYQLFGVFSPELYDREHEMLEYTHTEGLLELIEKGIVHEFEGCYYCLLRYKSYMKLRAKFFFDDTEEIVYVAHPLLFSLIDGEVSEDEVHELLAYSFVPECVRRFVEESYIEYKLTGKAPLRRTPEQTVFRQVEAAMRDAFLMSCEYDTVGGYVKEALRIALAIESCTFAPEAMKIGARNVVHFVAVNTLENIMRQKWIIRNMEEVRARKKAEEE